MSKTIRLYGDTHEDLRDLSREGETYNETIQRILPEELEVLERPEGEVVAITVEEQVHHRLMEAAGQNVNVSNVVQYYIDKYKYGARV